MPKCKVICIYDIGGLQEEIDKWLKEEYQKRLDQPARSSEFTILNTSQSYDTDSSYTILTIFYKE
jgi:hypothetical protein